MGKEKAPGVYFKGIQAGDFKGCVLKVKHGYNPNSSSLGSIVFSLPVMLLGISTLFGVAASILFAAADRPSCRKGFKPPTPESNSGNVPADGPGESA